MMRKFLLIAVPLIAFTVVITVGVAAQNKSKHRKPKSVPVGTGTGAIRWEPEEGSAFLAFTRKLSPVTRIELRQISKQDEQVKVLTSKILTADDAEEFAELWRRLKRGSGSGCFVPAYNLRFFSNDELLLDTEVCFGCSNLTLPDGGARKRQWGFDGNGPEGLALLRALKTLLSPMAQQLVGVKPSTASPATLDLGLLVDNSGSLRSHFQKVIGVSKGIVESAQAGDRLFILRFVSSDNIRIVQDFTTQKSPLIEGLDDMYVEGGLSAIADAVYFAAERLDEKGDSEAHKRALILITDGADEGSFYRTERLLMMLRERKVKVYAIGFPQALGQQGVKVQERARKYLIRLTNESGGRVYFPATKSDVENVANSVLNDIRSQ